MSILKLVKNQKTETKTTPEILKEYRKIIRHKFNVQRSVVLYNRNEQLEHETNKIMPKIIFKK